MTSRSACEAWHSPVKGHHHSMLLWAIYQAGDEHGRLHPAAGAWGRGQRERGDCLAARARGQKLSLAARAGARTKL
eukprot:1161064-Pelagomonas_calceolata.AAC.6